MVLENAGSRRQRKCGTKSMTKETALMNAISASVADAQKSSIAIENKQGNVFRRHFYDESEIGLLAEHRRWMSVQQKEYPQPYIPYRIGVYIRYYNQTKYKNYIEKHTQQFIDDISLCPQWTLVDFYIDKGMTAPRMENSKEWCRLLGDCFSGKVNLIVTQKVRSVSNDPEEMAFIARALATQKTPVGIYFISEDIFTLASYYLRDLQDDGFLPYGVNVLPEDELDLPMTYENQERLLLDDNGDE